MNPQPSSLDAQNATTHSENTAKLSDSEKVLTVALELRKLGYSEVYLTNMVRALKRIGSVVGLDDPSMVSFYIAKLNAMDSYKANLCDFYKYYCDYHKIPFIKPRYSREHKLPNVPTEEKI